MFEHLIIWYNVFLSVCVADDTYQAQLRLQQTLRLGSLESRSASACLCVTIETHPAPMSVFVPTALTRTVGQILLILAQHPAGDKHTSPHDVAGCGTPSSSFIDMASTLDQAVSRSRLEGQQVPKLEGQQAPKQGAERQKGKEQWAGTEGAHWQRCHWGLPGGRRGGPTQQPSHCPSPTPCHNQ